MSPSKYRFRACAARGCSKSLAGGALLKVCARCKTSRYCSTECQAADWPSHNQICCLNSSVDDVFRSLPPHLAAGAGLPPDLRRWERLHTPMFVVACISAMGLVERRENVFDYALVVHVSPHESEDPRGKFSVMSTEQKSFHEVSEFLRAAGYSRIIERHELENQAVQDDGALGYALVLISCRTALLPPLLQVKPVLISHEAVEAYARSPVLAQGLTHMLKRGIDGDWARLYHMSSIAAESFGQSGVLGQARVEA